MATAMATPGTAATHGALKIASRPRAAIPPHVTVLPPKMIDIVILPLGATIAVGRQLAFAASGRLDDLTLVPLDKPTWMSSDRSIIDVDQRGVATAKAPGDVVIHVQDRATGVIGWVEVTAVP